jgi:alkanesulfonate monooxygenase SsuD/methylene tetrahydromethanopterin reductase-like flavin-dependent oxidoreductase (luciferase family)
METAMGKIIERVRERERARMRMLVLEMRAQWERERLEKARLPESVVVITHPEGRPRPVWWRNRLTRFFG